MGILLLVTNGFCMHLLYTNEESQDKLYFITECLGRLLMALGIPLRDKIVKIGIVTEVSRLIYNIFWSVGYIELWSKTPNYVVPAIIFGYYLYLDKDGSNRSW